MLQFVLLPAVTAFYFWTHIFLLFLFLSLPSPHVSLTHSVSTYPVIITVFAPTHTQPPIPLCLCTPLSLSPSLSGLSPAQSEFNYLNTARTLELYGVELHYARVSQVLFHVCLSVLVCVCVLKTAVYTISAYVWVCVCFCDAVYLMCDIFSLQKPSVLLDISLYLWSHFSLLSLPPRTKTLSIER